MVYHIPTYLLYKDVKKFFRSVLNSLSPPRSREVNLIPNRDRSCVPDYVVILDLLEPFPIFNRQGGNYHRVARYSVDLY